MIVDLLVDGPLVTGFKKGLKFTPPLLLSLQKNILRRLVVVTETFTGRFHDSWDIKALLGEDKQ